MIRYNTKEDKLEMSYEDICMTLHDCSDTLDCSTGYGGTYEAIVDYIDKLQNNWNELKKWCKENQYNDAFDSYQVDNYTTYGVILKKMQELQGDDKN